MVVQSQTQMQALESGGVGRRECAGIRRHTRGLLAGWLLVGAACGLADEGKLPPNVPDPGTLKTLNGAVALNLQAERQFSVAIVDVVMAGGILTDELTTLSGGGPYTFMDARLKPSFDPARLYQVRAQAHEAREFFRAYVPDTLKDSRAGAYVMEAYAEILLADLFCSGIPLSTVDFDGDYTLASGSTTEEVYGHALVLLDTALMVADGRQATSVNNDVRLRAAVGRGRALLALGQYAAAAAAVAAVPHAYSQTVTPTWSPTTGGPNNNPFNSGFTGTAPPDSLALVWYWTRSTSSSQNDRRVGAPSVGDQEGVNGLNYRTSADPRTRATARGTDGSSSTFFAPSKYQPGTGTSLNGPAFRTASGIEARLIEAEAALQANSDEWLTKLNALRQSSATCGTIVPAATCPLSTLEDPGASLSDPAAAKAARVNLLFRERAFWLYLEGHRQSDLRRLIRQYVRSPNSVYPTGGYAGEVGQYGDAVVVPMPENERKLNPKYTGCFHQNA